MPRKKNESQANRIGRPPLGADELMNAMTIRLPREIDQRIEEIRASRIDGPTKSTIIRELPARALQEYPT
jgi:hypothetical protein